MRPSSLALVLCLACVSLADAGEPPAAPKTVGLWQLVRASIGGKELAAEECRAHTQFVHVLLPGSIEFFVVRNDIVVAVGNLVERSGKETVGRMEQNVRGAIDSYYRPGRQLHGIHRFDGDKLETCLAPAAEKLDLREFTSPAGSNIVHEIWKRLDYDSAEARAAVTKLLGGPPNSLNAGLIICGNMGARAGPLAPALAAKLVQNSPLSERIAETLAHIGPAAAPVAPELRKAFDDLTALVNRDALAFALAAVAGPDLATCRQILNHQSFGDSQRYLRVFQQLGPRVMPFVLQLTREGSPDSQLKAFNVLGLPGMVPASAELKKELIDVARKRLECGPQGFAENRVEIGAAYRLLARLDPEAGRDPALLSFVAAHPSRGFIEPKEVVDLLKDRAAAVPHFVARLELPNHGGTFIADILERLAPESVPALVKALEHSSSQVRGQAAVALELVRADIDKAVPSLTRLLADADAGVRLKAARTLVNADPTSAEAAVKAAVPLLGEEKYQNDALIVLKRAGRAARSAADALVRLLATEQAKFERLRTVEVLLLAAPERTTAAVPAVSRLLDTFDPRIVNRVLEAVAALGGEGQPLEEEIAKRVDKAAAGETQTRYRVTLARIAPGRAEEIYASLRKLLTPQSPGLTASGVLAGLEPPSSAVPLVTEIRGLLSHEDPIVRRMAAVRLGSCGAAAAVAAADLERLASSDQSADVRTAATAALAAIRKRS